MQAHDHAEEKTIKSANNLLSIRKFAHIQKVISLILKQAFLSSFVHLNFGNCLDFAAVLVLDETNYFPV